MKKRLISLFLAMLMLVSLCACGGGNESSAPGTQPAKTENAETKTEAPEPVPETRRDDMNSRIWSEVTSLDPTMNSNAYDLAIMYQIYDSFFEPIDGDYSNLKNCLVEDYTVNETATYYEFKVRPNVKWHNGDILTADDCVFSVERLRKSPVTMARISAITEVNKIDDMTFSITCAYAMPRLCALFSTASMCVVNKKLVEQYGDNAPETIVGTGAYKLESWNTDEIVLTAFKDGWRGDPQIQTIRYPLIVDTTAGSIAFKKGEIDQWYIGAYSELEDFKDETQYTISPYTTGTTDSLVFNTSHTDSWVSNKTFRQAVAHAIDRELVKEIATDNLYQLVDSIFAPGNSAYDPEWKFPYDYDPAKAKELLKECGYDGKEVNFVYCSAYPIPTGWATTIEACLRSVGINVKMEGTDLAGAIDRFARRDFDMACLEYAASYPDPLSSIYALFRSDGYYNAWCYSSEELDSTVLSLYGYADQAEQAKAMQGLDQWAQQECFYIPCYQVGGYAIYPAKLKSDTVAEPMFGWSHICYSRWLTDSELQEALAEETKEAK